MDSGSSASFVSERIAQHLRLRRCSQSAKICGIAGLSSSSHNQSIVNFKITPVHSSSMKLNVNAIVVPRVTCCSFNINQSQVGAPATGIPRVWQARKHRHPTWSGNLCRRYTSRPAEGISSYGKCPATVQNVHLNEAIKKQNVDVMKYHT